MLADVSDFVERLNRDDGPIPSADPDYMKKMWQLVRESRLFKPPPKTAGLGVLTAFGLGELSTEQLVVLQIRLQLLHSLFERGVLHDYLIEGEVSDEAFRAAATLPCHKEEHAEAMAGLYLKQLSEEVASTTKENLIAHGYNPDEPKIDSKFLAWMRDPC